jgi:hypothetical protein
MDVIIAGVTRRGQTEVALAESLYYFLSQALRQESRAAGVVYDRGASTGYAFLVLPGCVELTTEVCQVGVTAFRDSYGLSPRCSSLN